MPYKNPKDLLTAAVNLPIAIEAKLPAGAPVLSTKMLEGIGKMPTLPDFPMELPDLPPIPEFPGGEGEGLRMRRFVRGAEVRPTDAMAPAARAPVTRPAREKVPLVFE